MLFYTGCVHIAPQLQALEHSAIYLCGLQLRNRGCAAQPRRKRNFANDVQARAHRLANQRMHHPHKVLPTYIDDYALCARVSKDGPPLEIKKEVCWYPTVGRCSEGPPNSIANDLERNKEASHLVADCRKIPPKLSKIEWIRLSARNSDALLNKVSALCGMWSRPKEWKHPLPRNCQKIHLMPWEKNNPPRNTLGQGLLINQFPGKLRSTEASKNTSRGRVPNSQ